MLTFPVTNANRGGHPVDPTQPDQPEHRGRSTPSGPVGLVVHLELPARASTGSDPALNDGPDLHALARAVEELVRVAAPSVITRISVEQTLTATEASTPGQPEASHRLRTVPNQAAGSGGPGDAASPAGTPPEITVGESEGIDIDLVGRTLRVDGEPVELTRREFDLLAYLYGRRSVALSRRELMNAVWQTGYLSGDRTIDVHVRRVRAKLGRHAERLTTLRGFGYRFD
jgi:hypothetical protein